MKRYSRWLILLTVLVAAYAVPALAQSSSPCPNVEMILDTRLQVEAEAVCQAAQPWTEQGFEIFLYLTDAVPDSEDDWFNRLDRVETQAGIRGADGFDRNALALEASTATDLSWAYTITYGELLYDTPLDTDDSLLFRLKSQMRNAIAEGDPTGAFVQALNTAYEANYPAGEAPVPPTAAAVATAPPSTLAPTAPPEPAGTSPVSTALLALLGVGGLGAGGYYVATRYVSPALERSRRRARLEEHLQALQTRVSNVLNALDRLLAGDTPEQTVLYELFAAYGGDQYEELRAQVHEWLRRSQNALADAFDLRQRLLDPEVQEQRPLEQRVEDWEMLYLTLVGASERILSLTDEELRTLLDPLLVLERQAPDVKLAGQLDALRRELSGMPLKVELMRVDPGQVDTEGVLGYVDQVQAQIARLQAAREEAPPRLEEAQAERRAAEEELDPPFGMTEKQLFAGIDRELAEAEAALEEGLFLHVIDLAQDVLEDVGTVRTFAKMVAAHEARQAEVDQLLEEGYRPAHLEEQRQEIETDLKNIDRYFKAGDYVTAAEWITELNTDSQRMLDGVQAWKALHAQNAVALQELESLLSQVEAYRQEQAAPTWEQLQAYAPGNWQDVAEAREAATQTLRYLRGSLLDEIEQLNSMDRQQFAQAEQMLAQASADLAQSERELQALVNRLAEVRTAEAHIEEALQQTQADLDRAETYRDQEDVKIGPEVDRQIEQAHQRLAQAREHAQAGEFFPALNAQTAARELATAAYAAASDQVQEINALQTELDDVSRKLQEEVQRSRTAAQALPAAAQTAQTAALVRQVAALFSEAQQARTAATGLQDQALAQTLRQALSAYQEVDQLADQVLQQIATDRRAYDELLTSTRNAIHAAQSDVQQARWAVQDPDARGAGSRALQRANTILGRIGAVEPGTTKEALDRMRQAAAEAQRNARQALTQARQQQRATEAERRRRSSPGGGPFGIPGPGMPTGRPRSRSRGSSSRGASRRSSSRGSFGRSFSRGSSRRSVSRGSSRRR
jgi:hypothetical protein